MFRIRGIYDNVLPINKSAIVQVQKILREQFPLLKEDEITTLPEKLRDPLKHHFRFILFVAEDEKGKVNGFAFLSHDPELDFCYLDYICSTKQLKGRGIGGALYERVRQEALAFNTMGIFFECLPDDPHLCLDPKILKINASRLKFYERYGAFPIINSAYETPVHPGDNNPPYLVYDDLGKAIRPSLTHTRAIVRAILERKYGYLCPKEYIDMVVESFKDDSILLREPRYRKKELPLTVNLSIPPDKRVVLIINDKHAIHHIRERGYVESPIRIKTILKEIKGSHLFERVSVKHFSENNIKAVHDPQFVEYLKSICAKIGPERSLYPYVFPIRNSTRPPKDLPVRAGYYCIDTFTPLNGNAYLAAKRAVDCVLTGVTYILKGRRIAYALVRPPGHHAERRAFGGFCYFNSNAIAANYLSAYGKVAILDLDYHHGNGQQFIFYERPDVFTLSIHGDPSFAYPYFSGFKDERGSGAGEGFTANFPLPETIEVRHYHDVLGKALRQIRAFQPSFLIIALGLDTAKGDPTGTWDLRAKDFEMNGRLIGSLKLPTLVVQEGGYNIRSLGINAHRFFIGLWSSLYP